MKRFYLNNKQLILNVVLVLTLLGAFAFPAEGFARNFLFGLAAGTAVANLANGLNKRKELNNGQGVEGSDTTQLN